MGHRLFQSERNATLLIDVLRSNVAARKFQLADFVIMPDHVHLLITVDESMTIEKATQLIKGGFSYRLKKEFSFAGEVWQKGFSEVRVNTDEEGVRFRRYIQMNPVKAGLVDVPEDYAYCFAYLARRKAAQGLKPTILNSQCPAGHLVYRSDRAHGLQFGRFLV